MRLLRSLATALFATAMAAAAAPARAADAPTTMLVIDGSGSMWASMDGSKRAKIDLVRDALRPLVLNAGQARVGLVSFGQHCGEAETVTMPGTDRESVNYPMSKLNPRGKGPVIEGLRQTAKAIGPARPASVVLVADNADNCVPDTCEAAKEIPKLLPGVPVHVVSLAAEAQEAGALSCIAKITGGKFYDVKDAPGIGPSLESAVRTAMLMPGPPEAAPQAGAGSQPPPAAAPASPGMSLALAATLSAGRPAVSVPLHWVVATPGGETLQEADAPNLSLKLDPGSYEIKVRAGSIEVREQLTVEAGKQTAKVFDLNSARLAVRVRNQKDAEVSQSAIVSITPAGASAGNLRGWTGPAKDASPFLAPGTYRIAISDGLARNQQQLTLAAGEDRTLDLILGAGSIEVAAATREDGEPLSAVSFIVTEDDPESPDGRREVTRSNAVPASFVLPAGTYYIAARAGESEVRQRIAIGAGDALKKTMVLPVTRLKASVSLAGQAAVEGQTILYRLTSLDGDKAEVLRASAPQLDAVVKAGHYRLTAQLGTLNVKAQQDITLEPGKPAEIVLKMDAAEVALRQSITSGTDIFWEILDQSGKPVWHTSLAEPKALLAPGRYTVRLDAKNHQTDAAFEVRAGERRALQVGPN